MPRAQIIDDPVSLTIQLSRVQRDWVLKSASRRGESASAFLRRIIDQIREQKNDS
jgi:hypothetical protein